MVGGARGLMESSERAPKVMVFVGRTASGFNRFLIENTLSPIDPEILADLVSRSIKNYNNKDLKASNILLQELVAFVGVKDEETRIKVISQFGKVCDMYNTVLKHMKES